MAESITDEERLAFLTRLSEELQREITAQFNPPTPQAVTPLDIPPSTPTERHARGKLIATSGSAAPLTRQSASDSFSPAPGAPRITRAAIPSGAGEEGRTEAKGGKGALGPRK